jgi:hypothetical protein
MQERCPSEALAEDGRGGDTGGRLQLTGRGHGECRKVVSCATTGGVTPGRRGGLRCRGVTRPTPGVWPFNVRMTCVSSRYTIASTPSERADGRGNRRDFQCNRNIFFLFSSSRFPSRERAVLDSPFWLRLRRRDRNIFHHQRQVVGARAVARSVGCLSLAASLRISPSSLSLSVPLSALDDGARVWCARTTPTPSTELRAAQLRSHFRSHAQSQSLTHGL